ncbi:sensor histidine kinase [Piscinibacter sp.]|jgi:hypothetical protein|uniref:sensor histidine kinase n=1 Tax=Piscinibacter sp. TaxID=1903157 RepID=UPI00355A26D9
MIPTYTLRQLLWRELRIGIVLAVCIAFFMSVTLGNPFGITLVYSLCIGAIIQGLIEAGRFGMAYRLRKRAPDNLGAQHNWPGWGVMGPWIVVSAVVGYFAGHSLGDLLTGVQRTSGLPLHGPRALFLILAVTFVVSIGCTYVFYARGRMAAMEARTQAAQRIAAEHQLKLVESQLEPHMLFNTLANLRVLIGTDPPRAQAMLDHLIAFLRATLGASRASLHPLSAEFARVADYLDLMKVRMGDRLDASFDLPPGLADRPVPPLLLQPLVENAIKHGLEPHVNGGRVSVSARLDGAQLVLDVRDTGAGLNEPSVDSTRFGLQQVRERLGALYGAAATLELEPAADAEGGTLATVRIPVTTP